MLCHATGFLQVGSSLESHGEGVQAWPPCTSLSSVLHAFGCKLLGNGADDAAIQSSAEQYAIGYITHHLLFDCFLKSHPKLVYVGRIVLYGIIFHPVACVPAAHHTLAAVEIMSGQEGFVFVAESLKRLELAGHVGLPVLVMSDIQGDDSYGVACNEVFVALLIVECEGEYAAQALQEVDAMGAIECQYHLAVAARLVFIFAGSLLSDLLVIINLSVDGQHLFAVGAVERLLAALRVHDAQSLMAQDGMRAAVYTAPVWSAMTDFLTHAQSLLAQLAALFFYIKDTYYSTHM